jgi:hypothetical protein
MPINQHLDISVKMIKANQKMLQALYDLQISQGYQFCTQLKELLDAGLVEEEGCWFLKQCRLKNPHQLSDFQDRTGLECFINKIDIEEEDSILLYEQGFALVHELQRILSAFGYFNIILSVSRTDIDDRPNFLTCNVRFHKVRKGESWLDENLEGYNDDGLFILTTENQRIQ